MGEASKGERWRARWEGVGEQTARMVCELERVDGRAIGERELLRVHAGSERRREGGVRAKNKTKVPSRPHRYERFRTVDQSSRERDTGRETKRGVDGREGRECRGVMEGRSVRRRAHRETNPNERASATDFESKASREPRGGRPVGERGGGLSGRGVEGLREGGGRRGGDEQNKGARAEGEKRPSVSLHLFHPLTHEPLLPACRPPQRAHEKKGLKGRKSD